MENYWYRYFLSCFPKEKRDVFMVQEKAQNFNLGSLRRCKTAKITDVLQMGSKHIPPECNTAYNSKNLSCLILENTKCAHCRATILTS